MTDFALLGEALVIDLLNTRPTTPDGRADLIATPAGLHAWLTAESPRLPLIARPTAADVAAIHAVRDQAERALTQVRSGRLPARADLRGLNEAMRAAPACRVLTSPAGPGSSTARQGAIGLSTERKGPPGVIVAAILAEDAAEFLSGPSAAAVRACAAEDCTLLFVPAHPRRQWCSAARCGNRARVARYYRRHRDD